VVVNKEAGKTFCIHPRFNVVCTVVEYNN